ncbi:TonB-dependent receptor [Vibrio plantisponsor]|uniref:TonB-dependent receptor n=1 Tax=Vibrio plantisponsor TaxID=664643 RepID=A0ABU4ILC3_9VIBR|nr:TonB-dependent receptor [Vibrio plantisponsor]MDW6018089.1 TonB-dependent receptor [Vibrio plantisponsor]NNM39504.1 TonB-dependent receptor [Vibrio plantisponsor]
MKSLQAKRMNYLSYSIAVAIGMTVSLPAVSAENSQTETIVVTGERMDKSLKDTTTAVTVIGEDQLANGEKTSINDIATSAPNVVTAGFESISIRGIDGAGVATGGNAFYSGGKARVSTIVDGVAQAWLGQGYTPSRSWDVKQVEVLRGPQSTSQGTNSIGGALVVQTNDPTYYWETKLRAGFETYENGNVKNNLAIMTSGPLIQDELAFRLALDGNKGDGWMNYTQSTNELEGATDVEEAENINARLKLLWEPSAIPGLSAKLTYNRHTYEGEYLSFASVDYVNDPALILGAENTRLQDSLAQSVALDIDYDFDNGISNSLHIAYLTSDVEFDQYPSAFNVVSDVDNLTVENRLLVQNPGSDFSSVLGLYYSKADTKTELSTGTDIDGTTTTSAAYGETTYTLNPAFKLVGGVRFENEDFEHRGTDVQSRNGLFDVEDNRNNNIFLPKVGAIYYFDDTTTVNASVRKGYNSGGHALDFTAQEYYDYDQETVIAYEAGLLKEFKGGQFSTNLFYNDYSGYQAYVDSRFDNIEESRTYGVELAGSIWVTTSTQLRASAGYLETKIVKDDVAESGLELPNAPSSNLSAGFTQYIGQNFSVGADVTYVGKYYSDLENSEDYTAGDYVTADARLQYTIGDFTLDGYVTNLTDEDVVYQYQVSSRGTTKASVGQTRTFGLNATYRM